LTASAPDESHAPLATFVVPLTADRAATERSLRSIRAQSVQSLEILGVDLGDGDAAGGRQQGFVVLGAGEGIAAAWNAAAARSRSRYICFLRPGDEFEETYLEKCLFLLEVASLDVCGTWQLQNQQVRRAGPFSLAALLASDVSTTALIRREVLIRAGGFDATIAPALLMWDLWIAMAERGARGRLLPETALCTQKASEESKDSSFVSRKYGHLLGDAAAVRRLDAVRAQTPTLQTYGHLLNTAVQPGGTSVLVTMPFLSMGGAERTTAELCRELRGCGFRVILVTTEAAPPGSADTTAWFRGSVSALFQLPHFLTPAIGQAFLAYLIQREERVVLLQVGSGAVYRWLPKLKDVFPRLPVVDLLFNPVGHVDSYRKSRAMIDHVIVEHEGLVDRGEAKTRISVIPNAIDAGRFTPSPAAAPRPGEPFVVGFFGRLAEEKAPDTFVRIAARFRDRADFQFLICGTGPMESSLRRMCQDAGLEEKVRFLGFVDTREHLARCHVTVTCSRLDGRPNIVLESLAMGVPVVASRVGGIPGMAPEDHGIQLCDPEDVAAFCDAIERLASDREEYLRLAAAGRSWLVEHCSPAAAAGQYAALFQALAGSPAAPSGRVADVDAAAAAMLPAPRMHGSLPTGRVRALVSMLRRALTWPRTRGTLWTIWLYVQLRLDRGAAGELKRLFDGADYLVCNPDVEVSGVSPLWHYLLTGFREGRNPSRFFDTDQYLELHPDVADADLNPLLHYLKWGHAEKRAVPQATSK